MKVGLGKTIEAGLIDEGDASERGNQLYPHSLPKEPAYSVEE